MRAAQSKGIVDLLALWPRGTWDPASDDGKWIRPRPPWLVQCKYSINGGGTISPAERAELAELARVTGAVPVVATPGKNGRGITFINLHSKEPIGC